MVIGKEFEAGDSYWLINLAEKAVLMDNLKELAQQVFPEITKISRATAGVLYVDDNRLLKPQLYPYGIAEGMVALVEQYTWFTSQESRFPLIISADFLEGERVHLYPLWSAKELFGMVGLAAQKEYISGRKQLWVRFLDLFGGAVSRLIDRQQTERQLAHLNAYLNVSSMLSQSLGLHEMLEAVLYCSMDVVSAEASSVLLLDDEKDNFLFFQAEGPVKPVLDVLTFPVDKGLAGSVYHSQKPELINDVPSDPRFFSQVDSETGFQTQQMIAVPLTAGEERIGVLEVINKANGEPFTDEEFYLLVSIADEIAFAIRNARFFEYVVDSYCLQRQGLATCRGCKRPLASWTPCVKYREEDT